MYQQYKRQMHACDVVGLAVLARVQDFEPELVAGWSDDSAFMADDGFEVSEILDFLYQNEVADPFLRVL